MFWLGSEEQERKTIDKMDADIVKAFDESIFQFRLSKEVFSQCLGSPDLRRGIPEVLLLDDAVLERDEDIDYRLFRVMFAKLQLLYDEHIEAWDNVKKCEEAYKKEYKRVMEELEKEEFKNVQPGTIIKTRRNSA